MWNAEHAYRYDRNTIISPRGTRWATEGEIKSRLVCVDQTKDNADACGAPLISDGQKAWVNNSDVHTLVIGSTGSKKTRLVIMPTIEMIARAGESLICTDPKGELYDRTSGFFAQNGYQIRVLNLRDPNHSNGWSILHDAVNAYAQDRAQETYAMLNDFASLIYPESNKIDPFWSQTSRGIFTGVCGMIAEKPELFEGRIHLNTVRKLMNNALADEDWNIPEEWDTKQLLKDNYSPDSISRAQIEMMNVGSEKTNGNISVSANGPLQVFFSRRSLTDMLSTSDIVLKDIGLKKTVVYIIVPDEKTTLNMLVSLFVKRSYEELIHTAQQQKGRTLPVRVNYVLDEFCNMPTIPDMSAMISAARSRNIRFTLVIQGFHQLTGKYAQDAQNIKGNCNDWIYLASREIELLQEISSLCGNNSRTNEPLITTSQLQRLSKEDGEALLLCGREYPFITHLADISAYPQISGEPIPFPELKSIQQIYKKKPDKVNAKLFEQKKLNSSDVWLFDTIQIAELINDEAIINSALQHGYTTIGQLLRQYEDKEQAKTYLHLTNDQTQKLDEMFRAFMPSMSAESCQLRIGMRILDRLYRVKYHEKRSGVDFLIAEYEYKIEQKRAFVMQMQRGEHLPAAESSDIQSRLLRIDNPYVAKVIGASRHEWLNVPYYVLEHFSGKSLDRFRFPDLSQPIFVLTYHSILKGLEAIHQQGLYYGNLSMKSVMVNESTFLPKLYDFCKVGKIGTAYAEEDMGDLQKKMMQALEKAFFLSEEDRYISPEMRHHQLLDARTDIYSAGILLHDLLNQQEPFKRWKDQMQQLREFAKKACANDPVKRYQTMTEMISAFEQIIPQK